MRAIREDELVVGKKVLVKFGRDKIVGKIEKINVGGVAPTVQVSSDNYDYVPRVQTQFVADLFLSDDYKPVFKSRYGNFWN